jgi:hypothetical protein
VNLTLAAIFIGLPSDKDSISVENDGSGLLVKPGFVVVVVVFGGAIILPMGDVGHPPNSIHVKNNGTAPGLPSFPQDPDDSIIINNTRMRSLASTPGSPTNIISDRVHCNTLSLVASRSRCHTADYLKETKDVEDSLPCPMQILSIHLCLKFKSGKK